MRIVELDEGRRSLRFEEAVETCFSFLLQIGFRLVSNEMTLVRYESPVVFVNVFQSRGGYDLGFEVGLLAQPQDRLSTAEVLAVAGAPPLRELRPSSLESMRADMKQLARQLQVYGDEALRGNVAPFEKASDLRRVYTKGFMRIRDSVPTQFDD